VFASQCIDPSMLSDLVTTGWKIRTGAEGMLTVTAMSASMSVTLGDAGGKHVSSTSWSRWRSMTGARSCL
jgi:hypothetical protein